MSVLITQEKELHVANATFISLIVSLYFPLNTFHKTGKPIVGSSQMLKGMYLLVRFSQFSTMDVKMAGCILL